VHGLENALSAAKRGGGVREFFRFFLEPRGLCG